MALNYDTLAYRLHLTSIDPTRLNADASRTDGTAAGNITDGEKLVNWYNNVPGYSSYFATQSTSSIRPTYKAVGSIGKPYIYWNTSTTASNGSGACMTLPSALLTELNNGGTGRYTILFLSRQNTPGAGNFGGSFRTFASTVTTGNAKWFFINIGGIFTRYDCGSTVTPSSDVLHGLAYVSGNSGEKIYLDSVVAPTFSNSTTNTGNQQGVLTIGASPGGGNCLGSSELYEIIVIAQECSNSDLAPIFSYWNSTYGTTFNTSAGPLTAGIINATNITKTSQTISSSAPIGGTSPYSYQWYRSTINGTPASIATAGNLISGATTLSLNDSGLSSQTNYYYVLKTTDSTASTVLSSVLNAPTHGTITLKIDFLGDSITALAPGGYTPADTTANLLFNTYSQLDPDIVNRGAPGITLKAVRSNISNTVSAMVSRGTQIAYLMLGTNDAYQQSIGTSGYTLQSFTDDLNAICNAITNAGIDLFVNQLIWRSDTNSEIVLKTYNTVISTLSYTGLLHQGDTTSHNQFEASPSLLTDGLHPSAAGDVILGTNWKTSSASIIAAKYLATPTISSKVLNSDGSTLVITFSENVTGSTGFSVNVNNINRNFSISGTNNTRNLILSSPANSTDVITINYSNGNIINSISNVLGNYSNSTVINNSLYNPLPLQPPSTITQTVKIANILTWDSVPSITSYRIYRNGISIGTTSSTTFTDIINIGFKCTYDIASINSSGIESVERSPFVERETTLTVKYLTNTGLLVNPNHLPI